jgi:hypothetical protein
MSFDYERWKKKHFKRLDETTYGPVYPPAIMWAGLIWVIAGCLHSAMVLFHSWKTVNLPEPRLLIPGVLYLLIGIRAISGTTPGTIRTGIVSILYGLFWAGVAQLTFKTVGLYTNGAVLSVLVSSGLGGSLLLAGFLAVIAGPRYKRWHNSDERLRSETRW